MNKKELIKKIMKKKEFSELPMKDVKIAFDKFDQEEYSDEEKIKFTRNFLMENFSGSVSKKLLSKKNKSEEWILRKHLSTRERLMHYEEVYKRILKNLNKDFSIVDLGCGVNGFSYIYFKKLGFKPKYVGIEAIGQLVKLVNTYFKKEKINGKAYHLSLFELERVKKLILETKKPRIIFMFKVIDSLESFEKDYSKKLILEIIDLTEKIVLSFPTETMVARQKIWAKRTWILKFIEEKFKILDDFEINGERYIVFKKK